MTMAMKNDFVYARWFETEWERITMAKIGGASVFNATLTITHYVGATYENSYNKQELVENGSQREIVDVKLTADTLEKLQEKLVAYVGLAE